jgi:hypothetical protein
MHDRPTAVELLDAVRQFLEADAIPALDGTKKFHARVAANVLAVVVRELQSESEQLRGEWQRLRQLLGESVADAPSDLATLRRAIRAVTEQLCQRIRTGDADRDPWRTAVLAHVRQTVVDKLSVANPKFLAGGGGE